jgi:hypothetical protein
LEKEEQTERKKINLFFKVASLRAGAWVSDSALA